MGQRSPSETLVKILQAFLAQPTWRQPDLARHVGITPHALKKRLEELEREGVPLEREEESPTDVYWSVPKNWFPGGAYFKGGELEILLRQLALLPKGKDKERLMKAAAGCLSGKEDRGARLQEVVVPPADSGEAHLGLVMDAASSKAALLCRYLSERGRESRRHVSVQRVVAGLRTRFAGICHRTGELRWWRVDAILDGTLDTSEPYREADPRELEEMLASSIDGFRGDGPTAEHVFVVRYPEARWVSKNLPEGLVPSDAPDGLRVTARTSAVSQVARFVVSLGEAARPLTVELALEVEKLAKGALEGAEALRAKPVKAKSKARSS